MLTEFVYLWSVFSLLVYSYTSKPQSQTQILMPMDSGSVLFPPIMWGLILLLNPETSDQESEIHIFPSLKDPVPQVLPSSCRTFRTSHFLHHTVSSLPLFLKSCSHPVPLIKTYLIPGDWSPWPLGFPRTHVP